MNSKVFLFALLLLFLYGCGQRYKVFDTQGDYVDATDLVHKGYEPIYNGEEIIGLINPSPERFSQQEVRRIKDYLKRRINSNTGTLEVSIDTLRIESHTTYESTYFMAYKPVDVFKIVFCIDTIKIATEIRRRDSDLIYPAYDDEERFQILNCRD